MTTRSPRQLDADDLVLSFFTLGRRHDIVDRVVSAAAAGYAGIGLYVGEYYSLEQSGFAPNGLAELLEENDICLAEIEVLQGWADPEVATTDRYRGTEETAWRMADSFDCRYVQAIGPYVGSIDDAGSAFGSLCDRAGDHGLVVGLEFVPFTNIVTAADALAIVENADRDNGGICVDIWHHERGAADLDLIRNIPGPRILGIQMSDGSLEPRDGSYFDDTLRNRVPPGEGEFDVGGFIAALRHAGASVPWSVEVCNDDVWESGGREHVARCAEAMRGQLEGG